MKEKDRIWTLVSRKLAGEATDKEIKELEDLLRKNPDMGYPIQLLSDLWHTKKTTDPDEAEQAFERHLSRLNDPVRSASTPDSRSSDRSDPAPAPYDRPLQHTPGTSPDRPRTRSRKHRRSLLDHVSQSRDMLGNYFKIACRTLYRSKGFSAINISGLAIGIATAVVLLLWIQNEVSYDKFHKNKDRIYQVFNRDKLNGEIMTWSGTPQVMAPVLLSNYKDLIEEAIRVQWVGAFVLSEGDKHFEARGYLTDPAFLRTLSFPFLKGNPATALDNPHSVVLTEQLAKKLFGDTDPVGQTVRLDSNANFLVTGVLKDLPTNSSFEFEYLVPFSYMKEVGWQDNNWTSNNMQTYVLLRPGITQLAADNSIGNVIREHASTAKNTVFLHPMSKWRLYSEFRNGQIVGGEIGMVRTMGIIAAFILLIACINYMNLSTARSIKRAREVGIRKVIGAGRGSLIGRFLGESILMAFLAGAVALLILQPSLRWFDRLIDVNLSIPYTDPRFWLTGIAFLLFTGLVAGSYPAFYLSGFRPINVLKGYFKGANSLVTPRKILVVFQFSFAITFIICTIIIYRQVNYSLQRDRGYNKNNLAFVYIKGDIRKNYEAIRHELLSSGVVTSITRTNSPITEIWSNSIAYTWAGKDPHTQQIFTQYETDHDLAATMGLKILAGRDIDIYQYPTDSNAVLLNETAVKVMGFKNPVGQNITWADHPLHVVGVITDFVSGYPSNPIYPTVIHGPHSFYGTITFKLNNHNTDAANRDKLAAVFKKYNPDYPFLYYYADAYFSTKMTGERHFGDLASLFAGMAIFISCLGLFALSAYMAENRMKEVGVRKVLGASIGRITTLLSKDFLVLVFIAFVIASPVAWWCMNKWLEDFSYKAPISWWIFALTGILTLLLAAGTVGVQAIRSALTSPAKSLRTE